MKFEAIFCENADGTKKVCFLNVDLLYLNSCKSGKIASARATKFYFSKIFLSYILVFLYNLNASISFCRIDVKYK